MIALALWRNVLRAHAPATDEIDAVFAAVARHGVDEGERFHREAKAQELLLECFEPLKLVAHQCGALELQLVARHLHLVAQRRDRPVVVPVEKGSRERDALPIFALRAPAHARPEALLHLVADASGRAHQLEELALIREVHARVEGAIAHREHIVQLAHGFVHGLRALERTVVRRAVVARAAHDEELGCGTLHDLDEHEVPVIALHRDVESRTQPLDLLQLQQQRRELARRVLPIDAHGVSQNARALVLGKGAAEIAEQPRTDLLRLADVDDLAVGGVHAVDAGTILALGLHARAHDRELIVGCLRAPQRLATHRWHRAQKTVVRPSIAFVSMSVAPHRGQGSPPRPYADRRSANPPRAPEASR